MKPPIVMELMDPRSQSTTKIDANVATSYLFHRSSDSPVSIATDRMRRAAMMNSLRLVARSFAAPRACQAAQESSKL